MKQTPTVTWLNAVPTSRRPAALESLISREVKSIFSIPEDDELPSTVELFGLDHERESLCRVAKRLEMLLGSDVGTESLTANRTVRKLAEYLINEALTEMFEPAEPGAHARRARGALWDDMLNRR